MINPSKQGEFLNSPTERASDINDPKFENAQGYFPYDLTHNEFITPLFGLITPTMHLDTVPGDRVVCHDNTKLLLNQINGNFLSTVNQYVDTFYVSLRNVFPNHYEKLIPAPTKGDDLPNSALPQVPIMEFISSFYRDPFVSVDIKDADGATESIILEDLAFNVDNLDINEGVMNYYLGRMLLLSSFLSRGQLLDYLGFCLDSKTLDSYISSRLQYFIDEFHLRLWEQVVMLEPELRSYELDLLKDEVDFEGSNYRRHDVSDLSKYRSSLSDIFEAGRVPYFRGLTLSESLKEALSNLITCLNEISFQIFDEWVQEDWLEKVDAMADAFEAGDCINIGKVLAYQQIVAHYYSNDHVDNIFSSDLFMQNLRSIMFPTGKNSMTTTEPVFQFNGVSSEYDYISYGGFWYSLLGNRFEGQLSRQYVWATIMLLMRRSLRYGDKFATCRPNLLAVSDQLGIAVDGNTVSPIDVTKNILLQRWLNAANYIGSGFLQYMSSIYGIKPSDTGCVPRFISHRKITLNSQITNNTADDQGKQTTNLTGYSDGAGFDAFIDDFGYIITLTSFDVLPVYKSGIDSTWHLSDRYDYYNPMLQNIGDQPIRSTELLGDPNMYSDTFGYSMRNSEYKFKVSRAHGAFVNSLPGFMLAYPINSYSESIDEYDLHIDPDFVRDKPIYLDPVIPQMQGVSPGEYYHFIVSCVNECKLARKITATPGILF